MNKPIIHVHTQADKSTHQYARFMYETLHKMANDKDALRFTVHAIGPNAAEQCKKWVSSLENSNVVTVTSTFPKGRSVTLRGSAAHAACIHSAAALTGDGSIHVICDGDTVIVAKGWDDYVRTKMVNDRVGMIGSTYEDIGEFSSGNSSVQTYKKVPTFTWCALSPYHDWSDLDVQPHKKGVIDVKTKEDASIYNVPIGYRIFGEAGYQLPKYLHDHKLTYEGWRHVKSKHGAKVIRGLSDYHEEWQIDDGTAFVVHHRGSMKHVYRGNTVSVKFFKAIDAAVAQELKQSTRWVWTAPGGWNGVDPVKSRENIVEFEAIRDPDPTPSKARTTREPSNDAYAKPCESVEKMERLKVSQDGHAVRRIQDPVKRGIRVQPLPLRLPKPENFSLIRLEGHLEGSYPIVVPQPTDNTPYVLIMRNATDSSVIVTEGEWPGVEVPDGMTMMLLVDVDGVQVIN